MSAAAAEPRSLLVTGGSSGIGAAVVRLALARGDRVTALGRERGRLESLTAASGAERLRVDGVDVTRWPEVQRVADEAAAAQGGLDGVVAAAGSMAAGGIEDGDPELWRTMVLTNLLGLAFTAKATIPHLRRSRGRYVFLGSVLGRTVRSGSLYGATKHAVRAFAENLRAELVGTGIAVTTLEPGVVDTPLWDESPQPALAADDVAKATLWALGQRPGVEIAELVVRPGGQMH